MYPSISSSEEPDPQGRPRPSKTIESYPDQKWRGALGVQESKLRFSLRVSDQAKAVKKHQDHRPKAPTNSPCRPSRSCEKYNGKDIIPELIISGSVGQTHFLKHEQLYKTEEEQQDCFYSTQLYHPSFSSQHTLSPKLCSWLSVHAWVVSG